MVAGLRCGSRWNLPLRLGSRSARRRAAVRPPGGDAVSLVRRRVPRGGAHGAARREPTLTVRALCFTSAWIVVDKSAKPGQPGGRRARRLPRRGSAWHSCRRTRPHRHGSSGRCCRASCGSRWWRVRRRPAMRSRRVGPATPASSTTRPGCRRARRLVPLRADREPDAGLGADRRGQGIEFPASTRQPVAEQRRRGRAYAPALGAEADG